MNEVRYSNAVFSRPETHCQLVTKVADGGIAHAWHAQMFAQGCGGPYVIVIQGNDEINETRASEEADTTNHVIYLRQIGHMVYLIDALTRPICVFKRGH